MRSLCVAITMVLNVTAAATAQRPPAAAAHDPKIVASGAEVYAAQKCGLCHAIAGTGNKKGSLDGVGTKLSAADLRAWLVDAPGMTAKSKSTRRPLMKAYKLPAHDLDALVAYLMSLQKAT